MRNPKFAVRKNVRTSYDHFTKLVRSIWKDLKDQRSETKLEQVV